MSDDLVSRLRVVSHIDTGHGPEQLPFHDLRYEAADLIERLQAELAAETLKRQKVEYERDGMVEHIADLERDAGRLQKLVDQQADDESLWFLYPSAPEAYLQQALRKLHAAIDAAKEKP